MKSLNKLIPMTVFALASVASTGVVAQATMSGGNMGDMKMQHSTEAVEMSDGQVRKVDKKAGKITIKHGAIKNLDMPPMTMVYRVKDAALLDHVQKDDKVKFKAEMDGGATVVTEIEVVK